MVDPLEIIDEFGADALRFTNTAAMASLGGVLKLDPWTGSRATGTFGTKLWNACALCRNERVCLQGSQPLLRRERCPTANETVNRWIIGETARVRELVDSANLPPTGSTTRQTALYAFVWGKVCDWYVEFAKPLLNSDDAAVVAETRTTMAWVIDQCLVLLHPIMPFITEELWGILGERSKMLIHADWPTYSTADLLDADADRELNWVIGLIESIRSARQQMHVPAGLKVPMLVTDLDDAGQAAWDRNEVMIKRLARVESLEKTGDFPKGTVSIAVPGASFGLPLAGLIGYWRGKDAVAKIARQAGQGDWRSEGAVEQPQIRRLRPRRGCRRGAGQSGCATGRGRPASGGIGPSGRNGVIRRPRDARCFLSVLVAA